MIRHDVHFPAGCSQILVENLVHDSVSIREYAIYGVRKMLFFLKPSKELYEPTAEQCDQFEGSSFQSMDCLASKEVYQSTLFYDRINDGYTTEDGKPRWCTRFAHREIPEEYRFIEDRFRDDAYLGKFY